MTLKGIAGKARHSQNDARKAFGSFLRRGKKKGGETSRAFVAAAIVALAALFAGIALQESMSRRSSVIERLKPSDMAALLPAGAQPSPEGWLEMIGMPQSSYLVGYAMGDGSAYAAYLQWDKSTGKYVRTSSVPLAAGAARLHGLPSFRALPLGVSAPDAVLAIAAGEGGDAQMVLFPKSGTYIIATKVDEAGAAGPAYFPVSGNGTEVVFQDVNADGAADAVVTVTAPRPAAGKRKDSEKSVSVFVMRAGAFRYDKDLSWTLTTSTRVFPEPAASSATP